MIAWKCGSVMLTDVNHIGDPKTKEKMKAKLMNENPDLVEDTKRALIDYDRI